MKTDARVPSTAHRRRRWAKPIFDEPVISLACSAQPCLAKTESALVSTHRAIRVDRAARRRHHRLRIRPQRRCRLRVFRRDRSIGSAGITGKLIPLDFAPAGDVLSLRASPVQVDFATEHDESTWVGNLNLGPANSILLLDGGGALLAANGQVRLLRVDGTELDFTVTGAGSFIGGFIGMSGSYVEVITASGMWALDVTPGHEQIFLLPGVSQ